MTTGNSDKAAITKQTKWQAWKQANPKTAKFIKFTTRLVFWGGLLGILAIITLFGMVHYEVFGKLPTLHDLERIQNPIASEVYSVDGVLLGRYYHFNRTNVAYKDIPDHLVKALVATEDERFYHHNGVDYWSLIRVFFKSILGQDKSSGGGSTISQQLAKNIYSRKSYGKLTMPINKFREMIIATRLEKIYTKEEILELYLNTVSFGEDVYGIEMASKRFFNAKPKYLKLEHAAVLVGLLKATGIYNPKNYPQRATNRRNTVLEQMVKADYLTAPKADSLKQLKLAVKYTYISHNDGLAAYFREKLRKELEKTCQKLRKPNGDSYNLYTDGLKIHTTIHSKMQQSAQEAVAQHMAQLQTAFFKHWGNKKPWGKHAKFLEKAKKQSPRYQKLKKLGWSEAQITKNFNTPVSMRLFTWKGTIEKKMTPMDSIAYYHLFLNTGFLAMDPRTGYVKAWVGGINQKYFQYDHVLAKRQVGSTFKPFVYAKALERGYEPCDFIPNEKVTYEDYQSWTPQNADSRYGGYYSLKGALTHSVNVISAHLIMEVGQEAVIELARQMGIKSKMPNVPSIALGAADLSLYEMVRAYGTFANLGKTVEPIYLLKIENKQGKVLKAYRRTKAAQQVLSETHAYYMTRMMQNVVDNGTAQRIRGTYQLSQPIAGKTGTTQDQSDGWFMGYTPKLVAGVWVGGSHRKVRFRSIKLGQGANMALPIWAIFMKKVNNNFKDLRYGQFPTPTDSLYDSTYFALDCPLKTDFLPETPVYEMFEINEADLEVEATDEEENNVIHFNERPQPQAELSKEERKAQKKAQKEAEKAERKLQKQRERELEEAEKAERRLQKKLERERKRVERQAKRARQKEEIKEKTDKFLKDVKNIFKKKENEN